MLLVSLAYEDTPTGGATSLDGWYPYPFLPELLERRKLCKYVRYSTVKPWRYGKVVISLSKDARRGKPTLCRKFSMVIRVKMFVVFHNCALCRSLS